jgi:hypothetical protein
MSELDAKASQTAKTFRAARLPDGFSAQDHLMRLAAGRGDTQGNAVLPRSAVVYTPRDVSAGPAHGEGDTTGQESLNAAV